MNYLFIILPSLALVALVILYVLTKNAHKIKEDETPVIKFEPRKVTDLSKGKIGIDPVQAAKKRKYYKKKPKKSE